MDMEVLSSAFQVVACPNCSNTKLELSESKKMGLASQMDLKCSKCLWNHSFCNSKKDSTCTPYKQKGVLCYSLDWGRLSKPQKSSDVNGSSTANDRKQ